MAVSNPGGELGAGGEPTLEARRARVLQGFRSLARSAEELKSGIGAATDLRIQSARHPWLAAGAAAGAGLLVAAGLRRRLRRSRRHYASSVVRSFLGIAAGVAARRALRRLETDAALRAGLSRFAERLKQDEDVSRATRGATSAG